MKVLRVGILKLALKRGFFIEFDAKQFYGNPEHHFGPGLDAMIVDNGRCLVAGIPSEEAYEIELQAKDIGYTVEVVEVNGNSARYKFTLPPAK